MWVTLGDKQCAGEEHEVAVATGLDQGREEVGFPADRALPLGAVAQEVGEDRAIVWHVHTQLQRDGLTPTTGGVVSIAGAVAMATSCTGIGGAA